MSTTLRPRGAKPSPRHKLASATPHVTADVVPANWLILPTKNSFFLNATDGCCVTSEECININICAFGKTSNPVIVSDSEIQQWAGGGNSSGQNFLNGANLTDVMDCMQQAKDNGLVASGNQYFDGAYTSVDWTNRANLTSAIYASKGSVKISVDANVLESAVGNGNG